MRWFLAAGLLLAVYATRASDLVLAAAAGCFGRGCWVVWLRAKRPHARCGGAGCRLCDGGRVYRSALVGFLRRGK